MNERSSHLFRLIRDYLTVYLPNQKGASPNTAKSYREALSLLLDYICTINGLVLGKLNFTHLSSEAVEGFLDYIEIQRECSVTTRNNRLANIRSFVKYACGRDISIRACYIDLCKIPLKIQEKVEILPYFSESALKTILEQPDSRKKKGLRDLFFMILMYDTGARNQELLDVRLRDLHLEGKSPYVVITGKGRKTRLVPIMQKTVEHSDWLGHAQISTTLHYYANDDIGMKKEAIEKATSKLNPMVSDDSASLEWENDDEMIRRLYDLSN